MCRKENLGFVNTWNNFYFDKSLYADDGIHLNQLGAAPFGRLLNSIVREYHSKYANVSIQQRQVV